MKRLLIALPLVALMSACGDKKDNVCEVVQPIEANVSIVDRDASRWFHGIVWNAEANSLNTKALARVERSECAEPYTDSLVLYSAIKGVLSAQPTADGACVELGTPRYYTLQQNPSFTTRRVTYSVPLSSGIEFSAPWYAEYEGDKRKSVEHMEFYVVGDTLYTLNYPEVMGFTPEGLSFRLSGDDVASVTATYSLHYDAYVARELHARFDNWAFVCRLATEEQPLAVAPDGTYTLPIVSAVNLNAADCQAVEQMRSSAIAGWEEFTGETMESPQYLLDFDCYKVHLTVTLKDGSVRRYMHLATALYVEP